MKHLLLLVFLFTACASTTPVVQPVPAPVVVTPPADTVYLPGKVVHDTTTQIVVHDSIIVRYDTLPAVLIFDTVKFIRLAPSGGDDYPQIQAAVNFCIRTHVHDLYFSAGNFSLSHPIIIADTTGGQFNQVSIGLQGAAEAKNTPSVFTSNFFPQYTQTFVFGPELCKGCRIKNLNIIGRYTFPGSLSEVQIDTLPFAAWDDGTCRTNNNSPYAAIAIDPFSDPADFKGVDSMYPGLNAYYIPGMNQSGSTDIQITGVAISDFIAAVIIAPGWQENGEEVDITDCSIQDCRSGICPTNAQQKSNHVTRLQVWGGVHTVIDCGRYGAHRGDGTIFPIVYGVNIAAFNHQFLNYYAGSHPGSAENVYAEGLYKIGFSGGPAGFNFDNCQFNLQIPDQGVPFPDYVYSGATTTWTNTEVRVYGDSMRIILNTPGNIFRNGTITNPPVCINQEMPPNRPDYPPTVFDNVSMYLGGYLLSGNGWDSLVPVGQSTISVNPDFTGYLLPSVLPYPPRPGDLLICQHPYGDDYPQYAGIIGSMEYPVGVVTSVSGDTVFLRHIGQGLHSGDILMVKDAKIKAGTL